MKIECDKCGAKYSIADEKVRGKTFKIRCKKCSNVIIVRDKVAAAAAAAGDGAAAAVDEAAQAHPGWHLAINGETVGPLTDEEVRERYETGEIDKDTAIWQEGFEDWVPLGDVEGFEDLPERAASPAAAAGDDPFAGAGGDEYAAPAGAEAGVDAGAGLAAAAAVAANEPEPQSPRVSSLTGQRNENSVLFSLDSLQALATGGPSAGPGAGAGAAAAAPAAAKRPSGPKGLATSAPSSEGSGLIDIRALGAMVGGQDQGAASDVSGAPASGGAADDAALPSFGGAGLGGLASTPLVPQTTPVEQAAAAATASQAPARSNAPLYIMMVLLLLCVAGLGAYIVLKGEPDPVVVEKQVAAEVPDVKSAGKDEDEDEEKDEDEDEEENEDEGEEAAAEGGDEENAASGSSKSSKGRSKSRSRSKSSSKSSSSSTKSSSSSTKSSSSSTKSSSSKKDENLDVDCILNPDLAKCKKGGGSKSKSSSSSGSSDPSLPEKLTTSDIKKGISKVLSSAKACGSKHGAKPGTKVSVRLSISGNGSVASATAQAPHKGTSLGNCVAAALKRAKFSKFKKSSIGVVYPVRM